MKKKMKKKFCIIFLLHKWLSLSCNNTLTLFPFSFPSTLTYFGRFAQKADNQRKTKPFFCFSQTNLEVIHHFSWNFWIWKHTFSEECINNNNNNLSQLSIEIFYLETSVTLSPFTICQNVFDSLSFRKQLLFLGDNVQI